MAVTPTSAIPVILGLDVEPDAYQVPRSGAPPWFGFVAVHRWLEEQRDRLEAVTGRSPRFSWFVRMDPQVEEAYGASTYAVEAHQELFDGAAARHQLDYFSNLLPIIFPSFHGQVGQRLLPWRLEKETRRVADQQIYDQAQP